MTPLELFSFSIARYIAAHDIVIHTPDINIGKQKQHRRKPASATGIAIRPILKIVPK